MSAEGRYAKLSIATPMHSAQLCVVVARRIAGDEAERGLGELDAMSIYT